MKSECSKCHEEKTVFIDDEKYICMECYLGINEEDYKAYVEYHIMEAASCQTT